MKIEEKGWNAVAGTCLWKKGMHSSQKRSLKDVTIKHSIYTNNVQNLT